MPLLWNPVVCRGASLTDHPGLATTDRHPGLATTDRHPGLATTDRHPGLATTDQSESGQRFRSRWSRDSPRSAVRAEGCDSTDQQGDYSAGPVLTTT